MSLDEGGFPGSAVSHQHQLEGGHVLLAAGSHFQNKARENSNAKEIKFKLFFFGFRASFFRVDLESVPK